MKAAHDLEAEEQVLGALLAAPKAILAVQDRGLKPEHFYRKSHALICKAVYELDAKGELADTITVGHRLREQGKLDEAGGQPAINTLVSIVSTTTSAGNHAQVVLDHAAVRSVQRASSRLGELAEGEGTAAEKLAEAERIVSDETRTASVEEFHKLGDQMEDAWSAVRHAFQTGRPRVGLPSGFDDLDELTGGWFPGQLVVLAAGTGQGKSTLAQNIAETALKKGKTVAIFSLEMGAGEIGLRMIAHQSVVNHTQIQQGRVSNDEWKRVEEAHATVSEWPLFTIEDTASVVELRQRTRALARREGLDLLIVDYLQLLTSGQKTDSRNDEITKITRALKLLAREIGVPVLALSQLNRQWSGRSDKRPQLSDLRDSGSIEQDADTVLFIYRDDQSNPDSERPGEADVIVAKQRSGASGVVTLHFDGAHCRFTKKASKADELASFAI